MYHWVPEPMVGSTLYPLNELEHRAPGAWRRERAKYDSRKHVLQEPVPPLDRLWNDVLHLSTVHPAEIVAALEQVGLDPRRRRAFVVTVIFLNHRTSTGDRSDDEQWMGFDAPFCGSSRG